MKLTFDKWHAWRRCQAGANSGLVLSGPAGDRELAAEIISELQEGRSEVLGKIVSDRKRTLQWIGQSQFGFPGRSVEMPLPDPPANVQASRYGKEGLGLDIEIAGLNVREKIPHLRKTSGLYEILVFDVTPEPPGLYRKAGLIMRAEWLTGLFELATGTMATARLLAPAYRREELLDLPQSGSMEGQLRLLALSKNVGATRTPGEHCFEKRHVKGREYEWKCPLRESGRCSAYN